MVSKDIQTEILERNEESCQTNSSERKDFQVQTCFRQQGEIIATQTDISPRCNIERESDSISERTVKQEIAMPNIPNSVAQIPVKKRKLSKQPSAVATTNLAPNDALPLISTNRNLKIESSVDVSPLPNLNQSLSSNHQAVVVAQHEDAILSSYCNPSNDSPASPEYSSSEQNVYQTQSTSESPIFEPKIKTAKSNTPSNYPRIRLRKYDRQWERNYELLKDEIEKIRIELKQKRIQLGMSQRQAAKSVSESIQKVNATHFCRFENNQLHKSNMLSLAPVLKKWIQK